jgi:hypothetical protein
MRASSVVPPLHLSLSSIRSLFGQLLSSADNTRETSRNVSIDRVATMTPTADIMQADRLCRHPLKALFDHPSRVLHLSEQAGRGRTDGMFSSQQSLIDASGTHGLTIPFSLRESGDTLAFSEEKTL